MSPSLYKNVDNLLSTLNSKNTVDYLAGFATAKAGQGTTEQYEPIFSTMRYETYAWKYDVNISDATATSFNKLLNVTLDALFPKATSGLASKRFAVNKTSFTESYPLYSLARCTPDLTDDDCKMCLQKAVGWLPKGRNNGRYLLFQAASLAGKRKLSTGVIVAIIIAAITVTVKRHVFKQYKNVAKDIKAAEAMQFDFASIQAATNNFSADNKLGEGGFGVVYKGRLQDGQDVAVREKIVWKSGRNFGRSGTRSGLADPTGEEQRLGGEKAGPGCSSCFSQLAKELWALRGSLEVVETDS
ncbi:hypothetical protein CDL15_Pgr013001 [Punica granatum]|uniref:Gnk2-homologous domain-containing protein n=1 Tax=Punica granatum TaxID=22663 RepID=A0A218XFJ5_PUNGR|nr:hypothetical protein CDL15_Pgr013001 [Punica granatum]